MRIVGVVKNSKNVEKIKGAKIKLIVDSIELASISSDENGIFEYRTDIDFTGKKLKLKIEKEGFKSKSISHEIDSDVQDEEFEIKLNQKEEKTKIKLDKGPEIIKPESSVDIGIGKEGINIGISSLSIPAKVAIGLIAIATIASFALPTIEEMFERTSLSISPDPLSFNLGDVNANETISRSFSISNPGKEALNWKVSADKPWVNIKPTSGTGSGAISIDVNTAGLKQGSYAGIISIISDHGEKSGTISFNIPQIPVSSQTTPILKVSKKILNLEPASVGIDRKVDTLQISNAGGGTLEWQAKADKSWIDLSKTTGTNEGTIIITMNSAGMAPGKHIGTIIIASNGGTESVIIELNVLAPIVTATTATPSIPLLKTITVSPLTTSVDVGKTITFTSFPKDQYSNIMAVTVTWTSSNTNVGTIDNNGIFTAKTAGTSIITASNGTISGSATVIVTTPSSELTTITVSPLTTSVDIGNTLTFTAFPKDQYSNIMAVTVTWTSSNTNVGTIDNNGIFTAKTAGTSIITASNGTISGSATVIVTTPTIELTTITVSPLTTSVDIGNTLTFTAFPKDQYSNIMAVTVTWTSSNTNVGTIDNNGIFTAKTAGTSIITASNGTISGSATVIVLPLKSITVVNPNGGETWIRGNTYTIIWTSQNVDSDVKIMLKGGPRSGSEGWFTVTDKTSNTGSYQYVVPNNLGLEEYIIYVMTLDESVKDESDSVFYIPMSQDLVAPLQISPMDGSVFDFYPRTTTLEWSSVQGATSYTVEVDCYHCCQINRWCTDVGETWGVVPNIEGNSYTFDFVGAQPGRWRVWAVDAKGQEGPKSGWWVFSYTI